MSNIIFQYDKDFARQKIFKELKMYKNDNEREKILKVVFGEKKKGERWYGYDCKLDNEEFPSLPVIAAFAKVFKKPIEYFLYKNETFTTMFQNNFIKIPYIETYTDENNMLICKENKFACIAKQLELLKISKNPYNLVAMTLEGDAMETTIKPGSDLLIDTIKRKIMDGGIFAFNTYEIKDIRIRRLFIQLDKIMIIPDNKRLYEACLTTPKNIYILGQVVATKYVFVKCENH